MNYHTVLLVVIGLNIVVANSILKKTVSDNSLSSESKNTITKEENVSNSETEQNSDVLNVVTDLNDGQSNFGETLDIVIEKITNPTQLDAVNLEEPVNFEEFNFQEPSDVSIDNEIVAVRDEDYYYNDIINKNPNEIMDTAAGFVPIPIFKRRQKPRKQVAARRRFRKPYPYRRLYYIYPYYGYYRPSSLRFY